MGTTTLGCQSDLSTATGEIGSFNGSDSVVLVRTPFLDPGLAPLLDPGGTTCEATPGRTRLIIHRFEVGEPSSLKRRSDANAPRSRSSFTARSRLCSEQPMCSQRVRRAGHDAPLPSSA